MLSQAIETYFEHNANLKSEQSRIFAKRAAHGIYENRRAAAAVSALEQGLPELLHKVLVDGHASLDTDYEVGCRELNLAALYLHQAAVSVAVEDSKAGLGVKSAEPVSLPKIIGPRMTGGGFGGSVIALIRKDIVDQINLSFEGKHNSYLAATGLKPRLIWSCPSAGARILSRC